MSAYDKTCGRLRATYNPDYGDHNAVTITCPEGWNDSCEGIGFRLSLEEVRDLQHLLSRVLAAAGDGR